MDLLLLDVHWKTMHFTVEFFTYEFLSKCLFFNLSFFSVVFVSNAPWSTDTTDQVSTDWTLGWRCKFHLTVITGEEEWESKFSSYNFYTDREESHLIQHLSRACIYPSKGIIYKSSFLWADLLYTHGANSSVVFLAIPLLSSDHAQFTSISYLDWNIFFTVWCDDGLLHILWVFLRYLEFLINFKR